MRWNFSLTTHSTFIAMCVYMYVCWCWRLKNVAFLLTLIAFFVYGYYYDGDNDNGYEGTGIFTSNVRRAGRRRRWKRKKRRGRSLGRRRWKEEEVEEYGDGKKGCGGKRKRGEERNEMMITKICYDEKRWSEEVDAFCFVINC